MANRALEIARETVILSGAGNHAVISAPGAGYDIVIVAMVLSANGTIMITLQDDTASLLDVYLLANVPYVLPGLQAGWVRCHEDNGLTLSLGAGAINVGGMIVYRIVPSHQEY